MNGTSWKTIVHQIDHLFNQGTDATAPADADLLTRFTTARDQSNQAFESIVKRHGPLVLRVCRQILHNDHHTAEDAFQATFLVLARRASTISVPTTGSLAPWLHQVALRTAKKARTAKIRRQARDRRASKRPESVLHTEPSSLDPDDAVILHEEISKLPTKYRTPIVLCYFEGLTHDQAAAALHWPVGTVRGYLARARDLLRTRLRDRGLTPAIAAGLLADHSRAATAALAPALEGALARAVLTRSTTIQVAALASSVARGLMMAKIQKITLTLVAAVALGLGSAGLAVSYLEAPPSQQPPFQPAVTTAITKLTDAYGDPLPPGATARVGTTRFNHGSWMNGIAFTRDGTSLMTAGDDGRARIWNVSTGNQEQTFDTAEPGPRVFALAPDGGSLMSADQGILREWDVQTGRLRRRSFLPDNLGIYQALKYSPDGKTLAALPGDDSICIWEVSKLGEPRRIRTADHSQLRALAFSPDSQTLAATSVDAHPDPGMVPGAAMVSGVGRGRGIPKMQRPMTTKADPAETGSIRLWNVATAAQIRQISMRGCEPCSVAFSPDGKSLTAGCTDSTIRFYDPSNGTQQATMNIPTEYVIPGCLAFSPDGKILAIGEQPRRESFVAVAAVADVHLFDVDLRTRIRHFPAHRFNVASLAFSPDGKILASAGNDKRSRLWDVSTGRELTPADAPRATINCLAIPPTGDTVFTGGDDCSIRQWSVVTGRELSSIGTHPKPVRHMLISRDGRLILASDLDGSAILWNPTTGQQVHQLIEGHTDKTFHSRGIALSPDGKMATAAGKIWDVATGNEQAALHTSTGDTFAPLGYAAFTPDSRQLIAADGIGVWMWNVSGGPPTRLIAKPKLSGSSIALSPDGRFLAKGSEDAILFWHLASGREIPFKMWHDTRPVVFAFSPDGRLLVSGSGLENVNRDPSVRVWELASGQEIQRFNGHRAGIHAVSFFPDNRRIASASADATTLIWNLATETNSSTSPTNLAQLWSDLASTSAARAYEAIWALSASPSLTVPFLATRLQPIQPDDPIKDTSLGPIAKGETLRNLRAIAVLEKIASPEAQQILTHLATGLPGARETRDAKATLERIVHDR